LASFQSLDGIKSHSRGNCEYFPPNFPPIVDFRVQSVATSAFAAFPVGRRRAMRLPRVLLLMCSDLIIDLSKCRHFRRSPRSLGCRTVDHRAMFWNVPRGRPYLIFLFAARNIDFLTGGRRFVMSEFLRQQIRRCFPFAIARDRYSTRSPASIRVPRYFSRPSRDPSRGFF